MTKCLPPRANAVAFAHNGPAVALVLGFACTTVTRASAENVTPPPTPALITPQAGNTPFLVGHAFGSQGYTCLPTNTGGTSWTINPPRPEATLFSDVFGQFAQIITHFASINEKPKAGVQPPLSGNATWQGFDTSKVWAAAIAQIPAGSDRASCPNEGSIACV